MGCRLPAVGDRQTGDWRRLPLDASLFALSLALYGATLCRTVYWYDSAEYTTAAYTLGVPHPPGYPLYTLIAHLFTRLPLPVATSVNLLSALSAALAVVLCKRVAEQLGAGPLAAAGGALALATTPVLWFNATVAEVYAPALCLTLGAVLLTLRAEAEAAPRFAVAAALVAGLGLGVHYSVATCGLGYALLSLRALVRSAPPGARADTLARGVAACVGAALAGASVFVYVALRAGADVVPNYASPPTAARLLWLVGGGNYGAWFDAVQAAELGERVRVVLGHLLGQPSFVVFLPAVLGAVCLARGRPWAAAALGLAMAGNVGFFFGYRAHDIEVFLLPAVALVCALSAVGIEAASTWLRPRTRAALALVALLPIAAVVRVANDFGERDLSGFHAAQDYGERLCRELPAHAVVLNYTTPQEWKYDAVFGMYMKHVLGLRPDVIVVKNMGRAAVARLLRERRPVYLYAPYPPLAARYRLVREGDLLRVVERRR